MKANKKLYSVALASAALILFLIFISSATSAATAQNASSSGTYAYITNSYDNTVTIIDTATNTVKATVPVAGDPEGVAVNPQGTEVYVANFLGMYVSVINTTTSKVTTGVSGLQPYGVAFNPQGTRAYLAIDDVYGFIYVIDTARNTITDMVPIGDHPMGVVVSPDGKKVYVTKYGSGNVSVIDTTTNKVITSIDGLYMPVGIAISPDGKKAYVSNSGRGDVSVIDTATDKITNNITVESYPWGIAITPDGTKVYVANLGCYNVSVIDTATDTVKATVHVGDGPLGVAVTSDGRKVYVANHRDDTVSVIETTENRVIATVKVGSFPSAFGQFICSVPASEPVLPVANFSANPTSGTAPLNVSFTDTSTGTPTSWSWNFGDGTNSIVQNPTHKYSRAGNYTVALTATNTAGNNTTTKKSYIKVVMKPSANFTSNVTNGSAPLTVQFTDLSKYATSWEWNFGDRTNSTVQNPTHKYSRTGNYTVALTAINAAGNNTITKKSYIKVAMKPVANFTSNVTNGSAPLTVQFTDLSKYATSWSWSFGDRTNSTVQNPTHKYSRKGNYTVALTAINSVGNNTMTKKSYIKVK